MKRRSFLASILAAPAAGCCLQRRPSWTPSPVSGGAGYRRKYFTTGTICEKGQLVRFDSEPVGSVRPVENHSSLLNNPAIGVALNSAKKNETVEVLVYGVGMVQAG